MSKQNLKEIASSFASQKTRNDGGFSSLRAAVGGVAIYNVELRRRVGIFDGFYKWIATPLLSQRLAMTMGGRFCALL